MLEEKHWPRWGWKPTIRPTPTRALCSAHNNQPFGGSGEIRCQGAPCKWWARERNREPPPGWNPSAACRHWGEKVQGWTREKGPSRSWLEPVMGAGGAPAEASMVEGKTGLEKPPENPGKGGFWEKGQFGTPPHIVVTGRAKNQLKKASLNSRFGARIALTTKLARNVLPPKHQVGASRHACVRPKRKRASARPPGFGYHSGTICQATINLTGGTFRRPDSIVRIGPTSGLLEQQQEPTL